MTTFELPAFLPGRLTYARGTPADYRALARFHYCAQRPATWAGVWAVLYEEADLGWHGQRYSVARAQAFPRAKTTGKQVCPCHPEGTGHSGRVVAVAVLSYPTLASA